MGNFRVVVITVLVTVAALGLGLVGLAYSGAVNIAATHESMPGVDWFFGTLSANSIDAHTDKAVNEDAFQVPEATPELVARGASEYKEMCVMCHGGPGVSAGAVGKGLRPSPPDLSESAREMDPTEIFWVVRHGIRHSGMPSFGVTHPDRELWATAFFVDELGTMSAEDYARMTATDGTESKDRDEGGKTQMHR